MDNNMYEQEIDLKDLIFTVLRKWRLILVIALLLGVAAGGYKSGKELLKQKDDVFVAKLREEYNNSPALLASFLYFVIVTLTRF